MAENETPEEEQAQEKSSGGGGNSKMLMIAMLLQVVTIAGIGAAFYFGAFSSKPDGEQEQAAAPAPVVQPAIYHALDPAFVVNFEEGGVNRFLQATVQVMARDPKVIESIETHEPVIRNNLLLLLSSQDFQALGTLEGKEQLRVAALEEVRSVLLSQGGPDEVEAILFTSFVMQ